MSLLRFLPSLAASGTRRVAMPLRDSTFSNSERRAVAVPSQAWASQFLKNVSLHLEMSSRTAADGRLSSAFCQRSSAWKGVWPKRRAGLAGRLLRKEQKWGNSCGRAWARRAKSRGFWRVRKTRHLSRIPPSADGSMRRDSGSSLRRTTIRPAQGIWTLSWYMARMAPEEFEAAALMRSE